MTEQRRTTKRQNAQNKEKGSGTLESQLHPSKQAVLTLDINASSNNSQLTLRIRAPNQPTQQTSTQQTRTKDVPPNNHLLQMRLRDHQRRPMPRAHPQPKGLPLVRNHASLRLRVSSVRREVSGAECAGEEEAAKGAREGVDG